MMTTCLLFPKGTEDSRYMSYKSFMKRIEGDGLIAYHFDGIVPERYRRQCYGVSVNGIELSNKQRDRLMYTGEL